MEVLQTVYLDFGQDAEPRPSVFAKQYDKLSRYVRVICLDKGKPMVMTPAVTARVTALKPDGTQVIADAELDGDEVTFELSEQMLTVSGTVTAEIGLYMGEALLSSQIFDIDVRRSAYDPEAIESSDEYKTLEDVIELAQEKIAACTAAASAAQTYAQSAQTAAEQCSSATVSAITATAYANAAASLLNTARVSSAKLDQATAVPAGSWVTVLTLPALEPGTYLIYGSATTATQGSSYSVRLIGGESEIEFSARGSVTTTPDTHFFTAHGVSVVTLSAQTAVSMQMYTLSALTLQAASMRAVLLFGTDAQRGDAVIAVQPQDAQAALGDKVAFTVVAAGDGLSYRWQYRRPSADGWTNVGPSIESAVTATLSFVAAKKYNGYQYRCRVTDEYGGTAYSNPVTLTVEESRTEPAEITREIQQLIADALADAKASGEFKGDKGEKGDKGDTGAAGPQGEKGEKGDTGAAGAQGEKGDKGDTGATGPQGERGDKGDTGAAGAAGYTPVRGVDYWTAADKAAIVADVLEALPTAEEVGF